MLGLILDTLIHAIFDPRFWLVVIALSMAALAGLAIQGSLEPVGQ